MSRYFLAVPLSPDLQDQLALLRPAALPGVRLVRPHQMHLTLHFLGELTPEDLENVQQMLRELEFSAFELRITAVGTFPKRGKPKVIWVGTERHEVLDSLHEQIGEALETAIGFEVENRGFKPHITLARAKNTAPSQELRDYIHENQQLSLPPMPVNAVSLYESRAVENGHQYSIIGEKMLDE